MSPRKKDDSAEYSFFSIRIPAALRADLDRIAEQEQRSINNVINLALQKYVKEYKE